MVEHIPNERLAALLDDGVEDGSAREHLDACRACRRELDLLRRMRMALSAMDDLEPPADQWRTIEASLPPAGRAAAAGADGGRPVAGGAAAGGSGSGASGPAAWVRDLGWLRAAAGIVLFAGGLGLGSLLGPLPGAGTGSAEAGPASEGATAERTVAAAGESARTDDPAGPGGSEAAAAGLGPEEILRQLDGLGSGGVDAREAYRNPTAAAERLARLDAMVRAAREALEEDPADPAMNQFLFRVVEERQQLNRALNLASLDYR